MKYTAAMTVSRNNEFFANSVKSILAQTPDEFLVYLEPHLMEDERVHQILKNTDADIREMIIDTGLEKKCHHMANVAITTYTAIARAKHPWVRWCDDDDTWIADSRDILVQYATDNVALLHGDVQYGNKIRQGNTMYLPWDCNAKFIGSGNFFHTDTFKRVSHAAIMSAHECESAFLDWRIAYWMLQTGMRSLYVPKLFCTQNIDADSNQKKDITYTSRRERWMGKWALVVRVLEEGNYRKYLTPKIEGHI